MKISFLLLILSCPLQAQTSSYEISGYIKYLSSVSDYPGVEGTLYDQFVHTRVNTAWYPSDSLRGEMDIRVRVFYGDSIKKLHGFSEEVKTDYEFTNLDAELWDRKKSIGYGQIDRLWLDYTKKDLQVTLGRQRIAWGTSLVWNVIDLFNPKSVLDFDYEEKPGADAIRLQYYTGAVSKAELSVSPGKDKEHSAVAALYSVNISGYDFYGIAGVRNNRWVAGGAWAGYVLDGGFRGEVLVSQSPDRNASQDHSLLPVPDGSIFASHRTVVSFVLSGDYTFSNTFYIHAELLYNSNGKRENAGLYEQEAIDAGMLSPARWSIYQEFAYDINPLTRATLYGMYNPDDNSSIIVPMLSRSVSTNLDLLFIGFLPSGDQNTEFGVYGKSIYLRLKYSF
ncbi:MAG: hypothetical protein PVG39_19925 [Desulfobacteraceae bacterium]